MARNKWTRLIVVLSLLALPLGSVINAAPAPSCEGECDAYYSQLIYDTTSAFGDCVASYGTFMCSPYVVLLGAQSAAWGVCKAGCAGPYIMTLLREREMRHV